MIVATEEMRAIWERFLAYRTNPSGFALDVIGIPPDYYWSKLREVVESPVTHQKTAVKAGHSVSKTFGVGRIVVPWFKTCFQPSTVITTAPSDHQVRNQLWREIHAGYAAAKGRGIPLGGTMTTLTWDMKPAKEILEQLQGEEQSLWERNFATGFSTSADTATEHATKMHGWHNEWILVVLDEVCGLIPQITRTVLESLIVDEQCKVIALGNPTDPESDFARWCYSSDPTKNEGTESYMSDEGWWVIRIDARDNPNYIERKRLIPGLASYEWVQGIISAYGEDGDGTRYRVAGLFPTHKEGTYYGEKLAQARMNHRVGKFDHLPTYPVYTFSDYGDRWTFTLFVQFIQGRVRLIDEYWDYEGKGAPEWANVLDNKGYLYRGHVAGPDLNPVTGSNKKPFATGKLLVNTLLELGYRVKACEPHDFDSGIRAAVDLWNIVEINEASCPVFLSAASGYGKLKNARLSTDQNPVYHDQPAKTWHRHPMDAWRHLAVMYEIKGYRGETIEQITKAAAKPIKSRRPRSPMA